MRTETTTRTLYTFDELSPDAQKAAIEASHSINVDHDWWDHELSEAIRAGEKMGITIKPGNFYFSGFWSQGDGASFTGTYKYKARCVRAIKREYPSDTALHDIVEELAAIQKRHNYRLCATSEQRGTYYHSGTMEIDVWVGDDGDAGEDFDNVKRLLRRFADRVYRWLETDYEYLTTDEAIAETLRANEYEFTEDGMRA